MASIKDTEELFGSNGNSNNNNPKLTVPEKSEISYNPTNATQFVVNNSPIGDAERVISNVIGSRIPLAGLRHDLFIDAINNMSLEDKIMAALTIPNISQKAAAVDAAATFYHNASKNLQSSLRLAYDAHRHFVALSDVSDGMNKMKVLDRQIPTGIGWNNVIADVVAKYPKYQTIVQNMQKNPKLVGTAIKTLYDNAVNDSTLIRQKYGNNATQPVDKLAKNNLWSIVASLFLSGSPLRARHAINTISDNPILKAWSSNKLLFYGLPAALVGLPLIWGVGSLLSNKKKKKKYKRKNGYYGELPQGYKRNGYYDIT